MIASNVEEKGLMEWIDREVCFPDIDRILCFTGKHVFICELFESKWGNFYHPTDRGHVELQDTLEWTHWIPLPVVPK